MFKYCEMITNHEFNEPSTQLISVLDNYCINWGLGHLNTMPSLLTPCWAWIFLFSPAENLYKNKHSCRDTCVRASYWASVLNLFWMLMMGNLSTIPCVGEFQGTCCYRTLMVCIEWNVGYLKMYLQGHTSWCTAVQMIHRVRHRHREQTCSI